MVNGIIDEVSAYVIPTAWYVSLEIAYADDVFSFCYNASHAAYAVITIAIRLRYDYDPTTTYRARLFPIRRKQNITCQFFVVVVSQSNRTHIVISITSVVVESVVVSSSSSYRSRIAIVI